MIHPDHLRKYVIIPALDPLPKPMRTTASVELLLGTALKESGLVYLKQGLHLPSDGRARALGLWQMEPFTHTDLYDRVLMTDASLMRIIAPYGRRPATDMIWDLKYAAQMARLKYWTIDEPLPWVGDVAGMARYWSRWYNTKNDPQEMKQWADLYTRFA